MNLWQSIRYFISFGLKNVRKEWKTHLRTSLSLGVTFFLIFSLLGVFLNIRHGLKSLKDGHKIIAYLKSNASEASEMKKGLKKKYCELKNVKSCRFVEQEETKEKFLSKYPHFKSVLKTLDESPFSSELHIQVQTSDHMNVDVEELVFDLKKELSVEEVSGGVAEAGKWSQMIRILDLLLMIFVCVSYASIMAVIFNVVGVLVYGRKEEIEILSLVGATDFMLSIPFYVSSIFICAMGFCMAWAVYWGGIFALQTYLLPWLQLGFIQIQVMGYVWALMILLPCLALTFLSTNTSVKQFIK